MGEACIVYSFNIIILYYNTLSFGCRDEEISPFAAQIKENLILFLILALIFQFLLRYPLYRVCINIWILLGCHFAEAAYPPPAGDFICQ